jgi:GINS complex subunit 4
MADLYNLLEELDDSNDNRDAKQDPRRLTVETAVTEMLSDDDYGDDRNTATPRVPDALLENADNDHLHSDKTSFDQFTKGLETNDDLDESAQEQYDIPNELYGKLHQCWLQERHCPELLEYDEKVVQDLQEQFEDRQQQADDLIDSQEPVDVLMANLAQQDLDRAKFVLSDWLTHRLHKIESHPFHMREKIACMSQNEIDYLAAYGAMIHHHLEQTVTHSIPPAWKDLDEPEMIDQPDYEGYHFWLVRETIIDRDNIEHEAGSCLVAKYLDMKQNMKKSKVELLI